VKLKSMLLMALLALVTFPMAAQAMAQDDGYTVYCGTPYPFWWHFDGPRSDIIVRGWDIQQVGDAYAVTLVLTNQGTTTFEGGAGLAITHAAVYARSYADPSATTPPEDPRALLGTEVLTRDTLPTLRPGESATVRAYARSFSADANHILTVTFYDKGLIASEPVPVPWFWLRLLSPRDNPGALALAKATVEKAESDLRGYDASKVSISIQNVSRTVLEAGTVISVIHHNDGSAGGYWNPEDDINPNNPGNPYASVFQEVLAQLRLDQPLYPGQVVEVGGLMHVPTDSVTIQQVTVAVGN